MNPMTCEHPGCTNQTHPDRAHCDDHEGQERRDDAAEIRWLQR